MLSTGATCDAIAGERTVFCFLDLFVERIGGSGIHITIVHGKHVRNVDLLRAVFHAVTAGGTGNGANLFADLERLCDPFVIIFRKGFKVLECMYVIFHLFHG